MADNIQKPHFLRWIIHFFIKWTGKFKNTIFYNELCSLFQKPQFLQWIMHRAAGSHFRTPYIPGSWTSRSASGRVHIYPAAGLPGLLAGGSIYFLYPLQIYQFLQWIWLLCYKNTHFYNEFARPLQIISKSCKNTMFYNEFCTWFKNLMFYIELCTF